MPISQEEAQQACSYMAAEVHTPAFFEKLASHSIQPQTQAEAEQLLQLGAILYQAEQSGQYKSAAQQEQEQGNPFLTAVLSRFQAPKTAQDLDNQIKSAAAQAVQADPIAKTAALVYNYLLAGGEVAA